MSGYSAFHLKGKNHTEGEEKTVVRDNQKCLQVQKGASLSLVGGSEVNHQNRLPLQ